MGGSTLFDYGIGSNSLTTLKNNIEDLSALAQWYRNYGRPSETETVVHLVIPLLKSLGWTTQKIALEYNVSSVGLIDIALFDYGNRNNDYLSVVIEAKKFDQSCIKARLQANNYANKFPNCKRMILTDGIRYAVYTRNQKDELFPDFPDAYLNLLQLRDSNPIYECEGASEATLIMSSDWRPDLIHPSKTRD